MATPEDRIPSGYRQSIVTAITVFLGFSITFMRTFRGWESKGGWSLTERVTELVIGAGIVLQVASLFRALNVVDNSAERYRRTRWIFIGGVLLVIGGALAATLGL